MRLAESSENSKRRLPAPIGGLRFAVCSQGIPEKSSIIVGVKPTSV